MKRKNIFLQYSMIRGSIGKKIVIKHYGKKIVITKYPDMSRIKASARQTKCRNLFKEAVAWAKLIIADPVRKKEWQKRIRRKNGVYNKAITEFMLREKKKRLQAEAADKKCLQILENANELRTMNSASATNEKISVVFLRTAITKYSHCSALVNLSYWKKGIG